MTKTFFRKRNSQLVTYNSGGCATQVDYTLVRRTEFKLVKNIEVIGNEEGIPQYKLLVAVLKIQTPSEKPRFIATKRKSWRLPEPKVQAEYQNFNKERRADVKPSCVEDVFSAGWIRFVVKQRVVEYVSTKLSGGTMQLMLLKKNEKNGSSGN